MAAMPTEGGKGVFTREPERSGAQRSKMPNTRGAHAFARQAGVYIHGKKRRTGNRKTSMRLKKGWVE